MIVLLLYLMDELAHQVQHTVTRPGLLPEVRRWVTVLSWRDGRIASPSELASVEGQEACLRPSEPGSHVDEFGVHGEMRETTPGCKQRLSRVAVGPVLADSIHDGLTRQRVLELCGEDGDAVQEERDVEALVALLAVVKLPDDREEVGRMQTAGFLVQAARRTEVCELELASHVPDSCTQHLESAPAPDLGRQSLQELLLDHRPVMLGEPLPLTGLGCQHEVHHVARDEVEGLVVVLGASL